MEVVFFFQIPVLLIRPQTESETAHYETPDSECLPGDLKFMPHFGQIVEFQVVGLTLTEISQYKIPFCIAMTYPLAQRDRHTANICLQDSLNMVPGLQLCHALFWGCAGLRNL